MHTVESLCAQLGAHAAEGQLVIPNALALFDALHTAGVRTFTPRNREMLQAAAQLSQVHPIEAVREALLREPLEGFSAGETAALADIISIGASGTSGTADTEGYTAARPNDDTPDTLPLAAIVRMALALNTSAVEHVTFVPVDGAWVTALHARGPRSHTDALVAQERSDVWRGVFGEVEITGRIEPLIIRLDDTLASAGQTVLRYRYDALGGRDAWTFTSPTDLDPARVAALHNAVRALRSDARLFGRGFRGKFIRRFVKHTRALAVLLKRVRASDARLTALNTYTELCDEDARAGLQSLANTLRAKCDTQRVKLIALVNSDEHQDWLDALDGMTLPGQDKALGRETQPGERSHVRHIAHAAVANRRGAVNAFDTLPDAPSAKQLRGLGAAIGRLGHVIEALAPVLATDEVTAMLDACAAAQSAYNAICDAHDAASHALQLAAQRATNKSAITFADAQHKVIQARLPSWRTYLQPFL